MKNVSYFIYFDYKRIVSELRMLHKGRPFLNYTLYFDGTFKWYVDLYQYIVE